MSSASAEAVREYVPTWTTQLDKPDWSQRRMGTTVPDIDLEHLTDADFARIGEALLLHSVIVLKDQHLSVEKQIEFSDRFGQPEISLFREFTKGEHPQLLVLSNVIRDGKPVGFANGGKRWHTDFSFMANCGLATILYGVECPPEGANTDFADMYAAYEALDDAEKQRYGAMTALHSYRLRFKDGGLGATAMARCEDVVHPIVRTHSQTGRRALFLGCVESAFAEGMPLDEGNQLMRQLIAHGTQPQFTYSHKWTAGDVLVWDNRAVMHMATPFDEAKYGRIMHRTSTVGERPV